MTRARDRASGDFNGQEIIIDADGDTTITADTDDQIDFKIAGSDVGKVDSNGVEGASLVKVAGATLGADASTVTFSTSVITTTYKTYILYTRLQPKTDGARVIVRMNDNSGSLLNSVSDYQSQVYRGGGTDFSDTTVSSIYPVSTAGNASGEYAFYRREPRTSDKKTTFLVHGVNATTDGNIALVQGAGLLTTAEDNQGMTLLFDSGDIASGSSYVLFGVKE